MLFDVYEYIAEAGGYQGARFFTMHSELDQNNQIEKPIDKRIASAVSEEEAKDLCACTPEICRILAAIEESVIDKQIGQIDSNTLNHQLFNTLIAISEDRKHREINHLTVNPGFSVFTPPNDSTEVYRAISAVKNKFQSDTGSIGDLSMAAVKISITVASALFPNR